MAWPDGCVPATTTFDVEPAAQAAVHCGHQSIGLRWRVDPDHLGLLVDHMVDEAWVLVREAVVILAPDGLDSR